MKYSDIEQQLREHYIDEEQNSLSKSPDKAKLNKLWKRIGSPYSNGHHLVIKWSIAASIAIILTVFSYHEISTRNQTIEDLRQELQLARTSVSTSMEEYARLEKAFTIEKSKPAVIDTIYTTRTVYKTITEAAPLEGERFDNETLLIENNGLNLALNQRDVKSYKVSLGEKQKNGDTPWIIEIQYNDQNIQ